MTTFRSPMISIHLAESGEVNKDVQLFRVGTFHHEQYGKFSIDSKMLSSIQSNFQSKVRGVDIAIDYKHDSEDVAAGWIKEVYLSDNGKELWAKVDWTPNGQKVLAEKEFRYLSPEFVFEYQDNETLKKFGPVLLGAGLTNRPVIKKMEPVVELSEIAYVEKQKSNQGGMMELEKMSPEQLIAMIKELQAKLAAMPEMEVELGKMKAQAAESEKAVACAQKKAQFAVLLTEGKACKAQEQAFLDGDMVKFVELSSPVKFNEGQGSSVEAPQTVVIESTEAAQEEVLKLAEAKAKEKKISAAKAISEVLEENPALSQKIYG